MILLVVVAGPVIARWFAIICRSGGAMIRGHRFHGIGPGIAGMEVMHVIPANLRVPPFILLA